MPIHALETDTDYSVIWEKKDYWLDYDDEMPNIIGSSGLFFLERRDSGYESLFITALDSETGNVIWEEKPLNSMSGKIVASKGMLFRGTYGSAFVEAYDTNTGELLWSTRLPKAHSTSGAYYENKNLFVYTTDYEFFVLDESGEILATSHEPYRIFLTINGVQYGKELLVFRAVDVASKAEVWHVDIDKSFREAPIFDGEAIFIRTRCSPCYIYSIDAKTGDTNWKVSQNIISNLYVSHQKVYFLSKDSELVSLDRISGRELSRGKFFPPFDLDKQSGGYFITGDPINNMLSIAFGDNTQVVGLKILDP